MQLHFGADRDLAINLGEPIAVQQGAGMIGLEVLAGRLV
jgi:hypothetical protein